MATTDWSKELAPTPAEGITGSAPVSQSRDWARELGANTPASPDTSERVMSKARTIFEWLPGGEVLQTAPVLPTPQRLPATEFSPPLMAETVGALQTPGMLPALGELGGSAVTPGPAKPLGGAAGAGAGKALEQLLLEGKLEPGEIGAEMGISLLPEVLESVGRWGIRTLVRGTEGAKQIRWSEAARQAREALPDVFGAQKRGTVTAMFDRLREAGLSINVADFAGSIQDLSPGKFDDLMSEIRRIDRRSMTGKRYAEAFEAARAGDVSSLQAGDLQDLRSALRKRIEDVDPIEAKQLLRDVQDDIDSAIDAGLVAAGQGDLAREARRQYARLRASEEMTDFIERKITSSPDLADVQFNLRSLHDDLRRNVSRQAKQINRSLDLTPGARQAFEAEMNEIAKLYNRIELPLADVSRGRRFWVVAALGGWLSEIMLSQLGRDLFRQTILQGRGRMSPNALATIANVAIRENLAGPDAAVTQPEPK